MILMLFFVSGLAVAAENSDPAPRAKQYRAVTTDGKIQVDGCLNEEIWSRADVIDLPYEWFPGDNIPAPVKTECFVVYSQSRLYIGFRCFDPEPDKIRAHLMDRDAIDTLVSDDHVSVMIDSFNDERRGFQFRVNPLGVQADAIYSELEGYEDFSWDAIWDSAGRITADGYVLEVEIPFNQLRFPKGTDEKSWGFTIERSYPRNVRHRMTSHRRDRNIACVLCQSNKVVGFADISPGRNLEFSPTITTDRTDMRQDLSDESMINGDIGFEPGISARWGITPNLQLNATVNPDFSQVEVDQQVVNLSRFEVLFPERRQFFLENADLFANFGNQRVNPFFSRRIGLGRDTTTEDLLQIPIIAGARLSGKLDNNWRVGLLNMQTADDERTGPGYNFAVASVQRKMFSRSYIGAIFVNKQTFDQAVSDTSSTLNRYNRVAGLEYNLASADNVWTGKLWYQHSFTSGTQGRGNAAQGSSLTYQIDPIRLTWQQRWVGENFNAETGFVPRTNYFQISPEAQFYFYPKGGPFNQHGPGVDTRIIWQPGFGKADHNLRFYWDASFRNSADLRAGLTHESIYLFKPFDPSRSDANPLPDSTYYNFLYFEGSYRSDRRKLFGFRLEPTVGQFFNGYQYGLGASLNLRYPPFGGIEFNINYTYIDLPAPHARTGLFLIGPRIDLTFTKNLFLTAFFQYNDQLNNVNINTRLQWRFAPVSDFFLVFTDNYYTDGVFQVRNRAIVGKVTYWLNL